MVVSDSMFLFEITIKDLRTYKRCNEFIVTAEFADVFKVCFKNQIINSASKKVRQMKQREKYKMRLSNIRSKNRILDAKSLNIHSILAAKTPSFLISHMKQHPLEISVFSKTNPSYMLGSSLIPWSKCFGNYVRNVHKNKGNSLVHAQGTYNIYGEMNMKRVATVDMSIKLLYLGEELSNQLRSRSSDNPNTFMYAQIDSKPLLVRSTDKYSVNERLNANCILSNNNHELFKRTINTDLFKSISKECLRKKLNSKSDSNIVSTKRKIITKSLSFSSIFQRNRNNILRYVFGDLEGSYGNKIYYVGYFTVEKGNTDTDSPKVSEAESLHQSSASRKKFKFKRCDSECHENRTSESAYSLDLSEVAAQISVAKCTKVDCDDREHRKVPPPPDDRILLDISNITKDCCVNEQITEKVIGGVTTKMHISEDPCFCTCECTFGFMKKTTYCNVCSGYQVAGEELARKPAIEMPIPCPFFHKLVDKSKLKTLSNSGSESKRKGEDSKSIKVGSSHKAASNKHLTVSEKKSVESEKDSKVAKKKKRDDRFKFNYGYKAPQIGHSRCALPCSGTLDNVPKNMGWLWTAEKVPGMKFRPLWKPGATNKHVVRLLKIARNPGEVTSRKKRKDMGKKKRSLKRPLLVVHKKDGEYTVTMETMKTYSKPRALNQHPYEDKPLVTYTIGRTEEENRERLKKKERARRRLERAQRHFIQNTFRDMCNEICMKAYQQALGILPETEDPACLCYPALPTSKTTNMNVSCSCSEDNSPLGTDTDSDEWIVEFTPPNASFDPTYKGKKIFKVDNGTQYTYLDYRVKLVDRFGNPVPRFFIGPDGKQKCSDLGGFWSPDKKWLEINIDGFIAPDGRWAPNIFIGPSGEHVEVEAGKFQATNGKWLIVGVDGYIDSQNRWKFYSKKIGTVKRNLRSGKDSKKREIVGKKYEKSDASWSCFGDVSPKHLSKLGIVGHGGDRKLLMSTLENMLARGEDVNIPQPKTIFHLPTKKTKIGQKNTYHRIPSGFDKNSKCQHSMPSGKGIVAVDGEGRKTYFRLKSAKNNRPNERLTSLASQGISLSSFHVPCFSSFINSEILKQQNRERMLALADINISTQTE